MMETGISWLAFFYLFVKPLKLWGADDPETVAAYDTTGLPPRWPMFFKTWREYENIHILFWLGKDVAWINLIPSMWVIFLVPTFGIAWDMVFVTFWKKHLMIDHAHNVTILIWVMANAIWAGDGDDFVHTHSTHPLNLPSQHNISIHPINPSSQVTLSTHHINPPSQPTLSIQHINPPSQPTLSTHLLNSLTNLPSQPTLSTCPPYTRYYAIWAMGGYNRRGNI